MFAPSQHVVDEVGHAFFQSRLGVTERDQLGRGWEALLEEVLLDLVEHQATKFIIKIMIVMSVIKSKC